MDQSDFFPIPSPCVGICRVNNKGYCIGCLRSREERLHWLELSDLQKHQLIRLLAARRKKLQTAAWEKRQNHGIPPHQQELFPAETQETEYAPQQQELF